MKTPALALLASLLVLTLAGCAGLGGPENRIGSDYANVRLSGGAGTNARLVTLVQINSLDIARDGERTTVTATNDRAEASVPPIRALTLVYTGPESVAFTGRTYDLATDSAVALTYTDFGSPDRVWRAVGGDVTLTGDGRRPGARFSAARLEPDPSVPGNAARGVLTVSGFLNPSAPQ